MYRNKIKEELAIAPCMRNTKTPNAFQARIPIQSNWNLRLLSKIVTSTENREVVTFLICGWQLSHTDTSLVTITMDNHTSAKEFHTHVERYIKKELKHNTLLGPIVTPPFTDRIAISPMSTREKKEPGWRRILVDMSWPRNGAQ